MKRIPYKKIHNLLNRQSANAQKAMDISRDTDLLLEQVFDQDVVYYLQENGDFGDSVLGMASNGEYTDEWSEVDKICMVGVAYIGFYKLTGEKRYLDAAIAIADVIVQHVNTGDEVHSPLPFRVNLKTGEVLDCYSTDMIPAVRLFDELNNLNYDGQENR